MAQIVDGLFAANGKRQYVLGINYLSGKFGHSTEFWRKADLAEVETDFRTIRGMGVECIRLPVPITIMPRAGQIDDGIVSLFEKLIDLAAKCGLLAVPNFFHGGGFWNVDWVTSETAFTSPQVLEYETQILRRLVEPHRTDDRILAWDICNEPWWMFGTAWHAERAKFRKPMGEWARKLSDAMRQIGASQPFTIGVDHAGICQEVGADADAIAAAVDFVSPHFYSRYIIGEILIDETNTLRDTYYGPFCVRRAGRPGQLAGCFEFGNSTQFISEAKHADHMRVMFYSSLANGAKAWFPWVYQDYDKPAWGEYQHQPHEIYFGMLRADGSEKPAVEEIRDFSRMLKAIKPENLHWAQPRAAILTKNWYGDLGYNSKAAFNAFCLAKQAGFNVDIVDFSAGWSAYKLLISLTSGYSMNDMDRMRQFVEAGGTFMTCPTSAYLNTRYAQELFGVTAEEVIYLHDAVETRVAKNWMGLKKGQKWAFRSPKLEGKFLYALTPAGCEVPLVDSLGRPALTCNKVGKGHALHLSFPMEYAMSVMPHAHQEIPAWKTYRALRELAGLTPEIEAGHPAIETGILEGPGRRVAIFINHERRAVSAKVRVSGRAKEVVQMPEGKPVADAKRIRLPASGVRVWEVQR